MLHTDIQKHLQGLSLEDTLALAQLALEQAREQSKHTGADKKDAAKRLVKTLKKHSIKFPKDFRFNRDEANVR